MNPRRTRDYRKGTDEHLPTPILGRPHEPILPREFRVSKPEITPSHDAPASIASLREVGSRMNAKEEESDIEEQNSRIAPW